MRSSSGGCVAIIPEAKLLRAGPRNRCDSVSACGCWIVVPPASSNCGVVASPPILRSAPPMPSGLRVNCTALASARYSRLRDTPALIRRPKNTPM